MTICPHARDMLIVVGPRVAMLGVTVWNHFDGDKQVALLLMGMWAGALFVEVEKHWRKPPLK